jgi:hypothetical protein
LYGRDYKNSGIERLPLENDTQKVVSTNFLRR